ncbi:hypothetical protein [Geobacter sp. SVR]|uniref:hypothetical protein n=1 Tax=Geobacter sp. SVR TaxID=2495594 RepID=UPI00143EFBAF|nr:hypothetical protein [Geobacter sp. SVR]BCS54798.1 hypothetical protein GSVR_31060 [Geobacter sp. SVR]GCF86394.1 hypothetical protein GSbR_29940 [Geobacter sp. SVR]
MKTIVTMAVASMFMTATAAPALDYERALGLQALELADCAAYYAVCYWALQRDDAAAPENALALDARERALEYSLMMGGKATVEARVETSLREMTEKVTGNISNLATLIDDRATVCKQAVDNPFVRLRYWLGRNGDS